MADRTRVLVVDDHKVVRKGLRIFISVNDDLEFVGEAANGEEAIEQTAALQPDVVLMDLKMPVMDGPTAIEHIRERFPDVQVVALTSFEDESLARRALEAGAIGYLFKDAEEDELIAAIRLAGEGRGVVAPEAIRALIDRSSDGYEVRLTDREQEILGLVARGLTNPQISEKLMISVSTVNFHVHNILDKLGAKTRTEAVTIAAREGLIEI
jgi:DNA-binding NarL/FixJ family response regulator